MTEDRLSKVETQVDIMDGKVDIINPISGSLAFTLLPESMKYSDCWAISRKIIFLQSFQSKIRFWNGTFKNSIANLKPTIIQSRILNQQVTWTGKECELSITLEKGNLRLVLSNHKRQKIGDGLSVSLEETDPSKTCLYFQSINQLIDQSTTHPESVWTEVIGKRMIYSSVLRHTS
jgi:hypothetical protein